MKRALLIVVMFVSVSLIFAVSKEAKEYYLAGLRAYQMQDCVNAIKWLEKALIEDPSIEEYDPQVKFRMGYCAYLIGNYDMAKDYLSLYPDNPVAVSVLRSIGKVRENEEWKKWLDVPEENQIPSSTPTAEATQTLEEKKSSVPLKVYILMLGIFLVIYALTFFLELKTGIITKFIMKLAGGAIPASSPELKQVVEEVREEESQLERELEFNLDEILNAPLDTVDRLIYGDSLEFATEEEKQSEPNTGQGEYEKEGEELEKGEVESEEVKKTEKEVVMEELYHQEDQDEKEGENEGEVLTEEDEDEIMKKANEILGELEDSEESLPLDIAGKDIEEIMEKLEEKDSYDPEDSEAFMYILDSIINNNQEAEEVKEEINS